MRTVAWFGSCVVRPGDRATEKILARARQLVDVKKEDGFSALHLAALNNHRDVAEILIKEVIWRLEQSAVVKMLPHFKIRSISKLLFHRGVVTSTSETTGTRRHCSWRWHKATLIWCNCWWQRVPMSTWRMRMVTRPCMWPSCARSWPALCSVLLWVPAALRTAVRVVPPHHSTAGWEELGRQKFIY